jgi:putative membrane protein
MNDVLAGTERVLSTPLPLAYRIAISQITWVYVLVLPFQLYGELGWITIPGTISNPPPLQVTF